LQVAREAASQIKIRAEEGAGRLLRDATDEAQRLREEAEIESARRRSDAASDAEAELEMAKQQGREMVNEARAYRERVLSDVARRREMARQQIEQLVHGRDRLLQAFERSRLVAVDVIGELVPKRIGQFNPEGIARLVARPMQILSLLTRPFVRLLSFSTDTLLRLMGQRGLLGPDAPVRHAAKRRRIKTVMQELI
jgi:hypothetical protein